MIDANDVQQLADSCATYSDETLLVTVYPDGVVFYAILSAESYIELVRDWATLPTSIGRILKHARSEDGYCGTIILAGHPQTLIELLRSRFMNKQLIVNLPPSGKSTTLRSVLGSSHTHAA